MQSPRQLKVKTIEISPRDVLFSRRSEKLTKQRFVVTIPRFYAVGWPLEKLQRRMKVRELG